MYKKIRSVVIAGVKKAVYRKEGSAKEYVSYKKRHISLSKYKKIKAKKMLGGNSEVLQDIVGGKCRKVKKCKKVKSGKTKGTRVCRKVCK